MKIRDLTPIELRRRLESAEGLRFHCGPVINALQTTIPAVREGLAIAYADFPLAEPAFADFHVCVAPPVSWRKYLRRQTLFCLDGVSHFEPLPWTQAYPMLEWGLNWCVTSFCHHLLILHAAVVEKGGRALILPGEPGAGKSTLTAALTLLGGWRLLSDEMALLVPADGRVLAIPRPISLKNASLDRVRQWLPDVVMTAPVPDTGKGTVGHVRPPAASVEAMHLSARPAWVVFPRYRAEAATRMAPVSPGNAMMRLVDQAFNYQLHGVDGFRCLSELVQQAPAFEFEYSDIQEALAAFEALATVPAGRAEVMA